MTDATLRERQASLARRAVFHALLHHLEAGDADEVPMEDLANEAGVSRRTLYRYFPTRSALLAEAAEWVRSEVLELPIEVGDEGITRSFRLAASRLAGRPGLARALLRSRTGRSLRGEYRSARVDAIRRALAREVPGLSKREMDRAAPVLTYLCSSNAWITIQDESGLDARHAQAAVEWAIETLLTRLRDDSTPTPDRKGGKR
ncbi:MAG TPA: helix-turn-helix domain-containing protein [Gemmatimonadaceae bacterium]